MLEELVRFPAVSEDGENFTIIVDKNTVPSGTKNGNKVYELELSYRTTCGYELKKIKKGVYWIEELNIELKTDAPNAR